MISNLRNAFFFFAKHLLSLGGLYLNMLMAIYPIYYMLQLLFFCIFVLFYNSFTLFLLFFCKAYASIRLESYASPHKEKPPQYLVSPF